MLPQLAAGAALVAGLVPGPVTYDPATQTGFVDASSVRTAFGWSEATLTARAAGVVFRQEFDTADRYDVVCGSRHFRYEHHHDYGWFELTVTVADRPAGYHREVTGFRLHGAHSGISGATPPPSPGDPCPGQAPGAPTIDRARLVSSVRTWSLTATSKNVRHELLVRHEAS